MMNCSKAFILERQKPYSGGVQFFTRSFRLRIHQSHNGKHHYKISNPIASQHWPPLGRLSRKKLNEVDRRQLLAHLQGFEMDRMLEIQQFNMPEVNAGDFVEVRYELSRTQQTQAVFQGYCVEVRKKGLYSSFVLKNTYDGVSVTQLVPLYSPRLLNVRVKKKAEISVLEDPLPMTKDFRYKWQHNVRHRHEPQQSRDVVSTLHKRGIRSLEPKFRRKMKNILKKYMIKRVTAGLPPYTYSTQRRLLDATRRLEVRAEVQRRCFVYAADAQKVLAMRSRAKRRRTRWGVYKICKPLSNNVLKTLPLDHPLAPGNLLV